MLSSPILADQLRVLEEEHRNVLALSAPGYRHNVATALDLVRLCIQPSWTVKRRLDAVRDQARAIDDRLLDPEANGRDLEGLRRQALDLIGDLRLALDGVGLSVGAELAQLRRPAGV